MIGEDIERKKAGKFPILILLAVVLLAVVTLYALYALSQFNYLLFHSVVEIFGLAIAFAIFAISWNSRRIVDNHYFLLIGIGFLFVGGLALLHLLTYEGINIFPGIDGNWATQFWIAGRYMLSLSLLAALFFSNRRIGRPSLVIAAFGFVFSLIVASILIWQVFPTAFIDGVGLTPFKVASEFVVSAILAVAIVLFVKKRGQFSSRIFSYMVTAMAIIIAAEMAFTLYVDLYGLLNVIGHLLTVVAFYLIYKALIEGSLSRPYDLLFRNLKQSQGNLAQQASELTKVNRRLEGEISERTKVEEDLERKQAEIQTLFKNTPAGLVLFEAKSPYKVLAHNKYYQELFDEPFRSRGMVGLNIFEYAPEVEASGVKAVFDDVVRTKKPTSFLEFPYKSNPSNETWFNWYIAPVMLGDEVVALVSMSLDVTDRHKVDEALKEAQAKLREYATSLERLVEERTRQLKDSERLAAIGATAGMVGHDIRNPLQAISGDIYLLKSDLDSMPDGEGKEGMKESLAGIEDNVEYVNKIVQDLQDFARPINPVLREVDVYSVLCEDFLFKNGIPENISASCRVMKEAKKLVTDPEMLKRILCNLVNNAIQAMPEGGKLDACAYQEAGDTVFVVQDTGSGIPETIRPKLFTPLFTTKSKGQGFGLAVAKRMTEALGGTISYESEVPKGTKFIVRLPAQKNK